MISNYAIDASAAVTADWNMLLIPQIIKAGSEVIDDFNTPSASNFVDAGLWPSDDSELATWLDEGFIGYVDVLYRMNTVVEGADNVRFVGWSDAGDYFDTKVYDYPIESDFDNWTTDQLITKLNEYSDYQGSDAVSTSDGYSDEELIALIIAAETKDSEAWLEKYDNTPLFIRVGFGVPADYTLTNGSYYQFILDFASHGGYFIDDHYYDVNGDRTEIPIPSEFTPGEPVIDADGEISMLIRVSAWDDATVENLNGDYENTDDGTSDQDLGNL